MSDPDAPGVPALFFPLLDAAEAAQRRKPRLIRRHALLDVRRRLTGEVIPDFVVKLAVDAAAEQERSKPEGKNSDPAFETHSSHLFDLHDL